MEVSYLLCIIVKKSVRIYYESSEFVIVVSCVKIVQHKELLMPMLD